MADPAQRKREQRARDAEYKVLRGSSDYRLTFEAFRGTTAAMMRLCESRGLDHPEAIEELLTLLIHEADNKLV